MKKKSIYWWCLWFSIQILFAIAFAVSGAVFPILYQHKLYHALLLVWFWSQLSGRFQICSSIGFFKAYQQELFQNIGFRSDILLNNPAWKNKYLHKRLKAIGIAEKRMELLFYQILPQGLSFLIRIYVIYLLSGIQLSMVLFVLLSGIVIWKLSHRGKKAAMQYQKALQSWYQSRYDQLYQCMHYGSSTIDIPYPEKAISHNEWVKAGIGIWVFIGLATHIIYQKQDMESCLLMITWLGLSDHIWSMWQTYVEWLGLEDLQKAPIAQKANIAVEKIELRDVQIFPHQKPINISLYKGDLLWVRGPNGSGKTSFLKTLLSGDVYKGKILINQKEMLISSVCVLNSDMVIRHGRLKDYISWKDAKDLKLVDAINALPTSMNTEIDRLHGIWSKGMLQKLNLGYAIKQKASVYILDEACCHLPVSEEIAFYERILENCIVIVVSHQFMGIQGQYKVLILE